MPHLLPNLQAVGACAGALLVHLGRVARLDAIIAALRDRPMTTRELAERFEVSQRMIQKDMVVLQTEPFYCPLWQDERFRWRLLSTS